MYVSKALVFAALCGSGAATTRRKLNGNDGGKGGKGGKGSMAAEPDLRILLSSSTLKWNEHYLRAQQCGCTLTTITSDSENAEALVAAQEYDFGSATQKIVWIGGERPALCDAATTTSTTMPGSQDDTCWSWSDGTPWVYENFADTMSFPQPNSPPYSETLMNADTPQQNKVGLQQQPNNVGDTGMWQDKWQGEEYPALYTCDVSNETFDPCCVSGICLR